MQRNTFLNWSHRKNKHQHPQQQKSNISPRVDVGKKKKNHNKMSTCYLKGTLTKYPQLLAHNILWINLVPCWC